MPNRQEASVNRQGEEGATALLPVERLHFLQVLHQARRLLPSSTLLLPAIPPRPTHPARYPPTWVALHVQRVHQAQRLALALIQPGHDQLGRHCVAHAARTVTQAAPHQQHRLIGGHGLQRYALRQRHVRHLAHLSRAGG